MRQTVPKLFTAKHVTMRKLSKKVTKLVFFDLWETLVNEPLTSEASWEPFAKAYPDKISWPNIHTLIAEIAQRKDQSTEKSTKEILANFGVTDDLLVAEIGKRWEYSCDQVALFSETIEALLGLRKAGFKLGLITNTSRYGWEATDKRCLLSNHFDYLALSFALGYVKPEPEIFDFIDRTSGFSGGEIVMVGDSYKNDFKAPRGRGWGSILLDRFNANKYPEAKPVIQSLLQLQDTLL